MTRENRAGGAITKLLGLVVLVFFAVPVCLLVVANRDGRPSNAGRSQLKAMADGGSGSSPERRPLIRATAKQLAKECYRNEAAFEQKYDNRDVEIRGRVSRIDSGYSDATISIGPMSAFIQADVSKSEAAKLRRGQVLTMVCGDVSESMGLVIANDCEMKQSPAADDGGR